MSVRRLASAESEPSTYFTRPAVGQLPVIPLEAVLRVGIDHKTSTQRSVDVSPIVDNAEQTLVDAAYDEAAANAAVPDMDPADRSALFGELVDSIAMVARAASDGEAVRIFGSPEKAFDWADAGLHIGWSDTRFGPSFVMPPMDNANGKRWQFPKFVEWLSAVWMELNPVEQAIALASIDDDANDFLSRWAESAKEHIKPITREEVQATIEEMLDDYDTIPILKGVETLDDEDVDALGARIWAHLARALRARGGGGGGGGGGGKGGGLRSRIRNLPLRLPDVPQKI